MPGLPDLVSRLRAAGCVYAEEEAALLRADTTTPEALEHLAVRRLDGAPLEHVLGWAEFTGLRIAVDEGVFVPRRRTELLVRATAELLRPAAVLVDVCCGSGAVAAAVLAAVPGLDVHACDIDVAATRCARRNLPGATVHQGDLLDALPIELRGHVDVITANAPYVPTDEIATMPPEARDHEPRVALDGGVDGLALHRRVFAEAGPWLAPGGRIVIETSRAQAAGTVAIATEAGFAATVLTDDDLDATAVVARAQPADVQRP